MTPSTSSLGLDRHRDDRARHVAAVLGDAACEAGVFADVVDRDRLSGRRDPAGDALPDGDARPDDLAAPGRDVEDELAGVLVEQRQRAGSGSEHLARDRGDRLQQVVVSRRGQHRTEVCGDASELLQHAALVGHHDATISRTVTFAPA